MVGSEEQKEADVIFMGFLNRIFDKKVLDETMKAYDVEKIRDWLADVQKIDSFEYFYYPPGSKSYTHNEHLKSQSTKKILSKLESRFSESSNLCVEVQHKVYNSGRQEIILRRRDATNEITKLAVLKLKPNPTK